tara:strand:- start:314 stop:505 length:192 start_codon:yes stop_codon:yes gene_type:complete
MKRKVGRPRKLTKKDYKGVQIRLETYEMLVEYQDKIQQDRGYKVSKNDLIHLAVKRLVAGDLV